MRILICHLLCGKITAEEVIFMELKDRLKSLRLQENITATQLAAQINKGESAVRMWEIGRSKPDVDTLIKLAKYFNCTTDFLLGLSEYMNEEDKACVIGELEEVSDHINNLPHEQKHKMLYIIHRLMMGLIVSEDNEEFKNLYLDTYDKITEILILSIFEARDFSKTMLNYRHELEDVLKNYDGVTDKELLKEQLREKLKRHFDRHYSSLNYFRHNKYSAIDFVTRFFAIVEEFVFGIDKIKDQETYFELFSEYLSELFNTPTEIGKDREGSKIEYIHLSKSINVLEAQIKEKIFGNKSLYDFNLR